MVVPMRLNAELTTKPEADMTRLDQIGRGSEKTRRLGKGREGNEKGTRRAAWGLAKVPFQVSIPTAFQTPNIDHLR